MRALLLAMVFVAVGACGRRGPSTDSKSNWLHDCGTHLDCGDGLSCVCGVCTIACTGAPACDRNAVDTVCVDPAGAGLPAACATQLEAVGTSVCFAQCSVNAQCRTAQVCVKGSCIAEAVATRAPGIDGGRIEGAGTGGVLEDPDPFDPPLPLSDAARPPGRRDGGFISIPMFDGGIPGDGSVGPNDGGWSDAAVYDCEGIENCCSLDTFCPGNLVCHVDHTCVEPGVADSDGVATLTAPAPGDAALFAANDEYVFGTDSVASEQGLLLRWPVTGGAGERVALDQMSFGPLTRMLVDGDFLYFIANEDPIAEPSMSLYRVEADGSSAPVDSYGSAGFYLVQDAESLYFTDPDNKSVIRVRKAALNDRQTVHVAETGAAGAITGLAINSSALFVMEVPVGGGADDGPPFIVNAIDKVSLASSRVEREPTAIVAPNFVFATDTHLIVADPGGLERTNLANGGFAQWSINVQSPGQIGGSLYFAAALTTAVQVKRFDVTSGAAPETLLTADHVEFVVPSRVATFAKVRTEGAHWGIVRIDPQ